MVRARSEPAAAPNINHHSTFKNVLMTHVHIVLLAKASQLRDCINCVYQQRPVVSRITRQASAWLSPALCFPTTPAPVGKNFNACICWPNWTPGGHGALN